jgi:two-component system LytT family sensor kinase
VRVPFKLRVRPWMFVSAAWLAPAVLATIDHVAQRRLNGDPPATVRELLWAGGDWLIYAFLVPVIFWISDRWPIERPHILRRTLFHLGVSLFFCVAWALGGTLLQVTLGLLFNPDGVHRMVQKAGDRFWQEFGRNTLSWIFTTLPFGVIVYLCMAGIAHAIRYFAESADREVQLARLSEQLSGARFSALQAQLNPHFLFNTLNTIAVRARDGDSAGTVRMVEQLSDILRRTLTRHRTNEVPLEEELELVRQYLAIEQARFSDRLHATFAIDDAVLAAAVPSFALQHLVENAVRHGIAKRPDAGRVTVTARRSQDALEITVADDGPGIDPRREHPAGHGIENTRERLRALYGSAASLEVRREPTGGTIATLRLPYREIAMESTDVNS